jgi:hypothetical protein
MMTILWCKSLFPSWYQSTALLRPHCQVINEDVEQYRRKRATLPHTSQQSAGVRVKGSQATPRPLGPWLYCCDKGHVEKQGNVSFYTASQSIEMSNIMERSHSCKVMEYPVVETYHWNFVYYCCNMTWWPIYGVSHCSKIKIWIRSDSIQPPSQLRCPTSWNGRIVVKLWNIQW